MQCITSPYCRYPEPRQCRLYSRYGRHTPRSEEYRYHPDTLSYRPHTSHLFKNKNNSHLNKSLFYTSIIKGRLKVSSILSCNLVSVYLIPNISNSEYTYIIKHSIKPLFVIVFTVTHFLVSTYAHVHAIWIEISFTSNNIWFKQVSQQNYEGMREDDDYRNNTYHNSVHLTCPGSHCQSHTSSPSGYSCLLSYTWTCPPPHSDCCCDLLPKTNFRKCRSLNSKMVLNNKKPIS